MTPAFGPPTISEEKFSDTLAGSPALGEQPAAIYYECVKAYGLDPAFMLAIFKHESDCGRNPKAVVNRYGTRNWGNTRSLSLRPVALHLDCPVVATDRGPFVAFSSWLKGLNDACNRLVSPEYPYAKANARTVETIIPIWAPDSDGNSSAGYVAAVVKHMREWRDLPMPSAPPIREALIPIHNSNRPVQLLQGGRPTFITIHETANTKPGANAEMHRRFTHGSGGWGGGGHPGRTVGGAWEPEYEGVSFHYVVDDKEIVRLLPDREIGYHAGDGLGKNSGGATSIGIETCVNSDGNFNKALINLVQLVAHLMRTYDIPLANVVQHNKWTGKDCPHQLRRIGWAGLVAAVKVATSAPPAPAPFVHAPGWLAPVAYTHSHGGDTAGIITKIITEVYNDEKEQFYRLTWTPAEGEQVEAID